MSHPGLVSTKYEGDIIMVECPSDLLNYYSPTKVKPYNRICWGLKLVFNNSSVEQTGEMKSDTLFVRITDTSGHDLSYVPKQLQLHLLSDCQGLGDVSGNYSGKIVI